MNQLVKDFQELHQKAKTEWWRDAKITFDKESLESIQGLTALSDEDIKTVYGKIVPVSVMKKKLLELEFQNIEVKTKKEMDLKEFMEEANKLFSRYQCKAGGQLFEDYQWIKHEHLSDHYRVKKNEVFYENSIPIKFAMDQSTKDYLVRLVSLLNSLAENINVRYREYYKNDLKWIVIKCSLE